MKKKKLVWKKNYWFLLGLLLIALTSFILYRDLLNTFFTQDEWWELGRAVDARSQGLKYYFTPWGGHVVPLMIFFLNLQFKLFGTNAAPYAWVSIIGHAVIAILWAIFINRLTGKKIIGFLAGFVFVVNTAPFHSITYIAGGATHVLGSTFFFLLSIFSFAKYIKSNYQRKFLFFSLLSIFLGIFFMEYVAFYFFFAPLLYFIFTPRKQWKKVGFWVDQAIVLGLGITFFIYRFLSQKIHIYGSQFIGVRTVDDPSLKVASPVVDYFFALVKNTSKLLPRILYQVWMNEEWINTTPQIAANLEAFSIKMSLLTLFLVALTIFLFYKLKEKLLAKTTLAALLLIIFGGFPAYIFTTFVNVIYSRYLYAPSLGFSLLLALFLVAIAQTIARLFHQQKFKILVYLLVIPAALIPLFKENYHHITKRLKSTVIVSKMRQQILKQALDYYPEIGPQSVFYTATNLRTPGISWPVHLGYSFLVMYTYQGNYQGSGEFFRSNKLWPVSEGFEKHGDLAFGHFHDFEPLLKTLRENQLSEENVYAFYWQATEDSKRNLEVVHSQPPIYDGELLDITQEIRPIVKNFLATEKDLEIEKEVGALFWPEIQVSFDRSSTATFLNSRGLIETAEYAVPRLTNGGRGKQGVLIEGYSANLLLFSEDFEQADWEKSSGVRVTGKSDIGPDGKKNASRLFFDQPSDYLAQEVSYSVRDEGPIQYTFSLYLKSPARKKIELGLVNTQGEGMKESFWVEPNWQRFQLTGELEVGGPIVARVTNTSGEIFAWGGQLEAYPYATSYIPTGQEIRNRSGDVFRAYSKQAIPMASGTVSFWVKPEWSPESDLSHSLFYNGDDPNFNCLGVEASPQLLRFKIVDAENQPKYVDYSWDFTQLKKQGWIHLTVSWSKGRMNLYLNGQPVGKAGGSGSGVLGEELNFAWPYRIGVHHGWYSLYADAIISDLKLDSQALGGNEILGNYLSEKGNYF